MILRLVGLILLLWAGKVQAVLLTPNQPKLIAGGQLEVLVEAASNQAAAPHLAIPISWQAHFELLEQVHQVEAQRNGHYMHRWFLVLQHQQADSISRELQLPPLQVNGENSQPLQVIVEAARKKTRVIPQRLSQPLTMQQQVDFTHAYIGQTLVYELLIRYQGFPIEPRLSPLEVEGATARPFGDGREQGFNQRGISWQEARWQELIQLHTSEALIAPRFFSSRLSLSGQASDSLYETETPALKINVRPIPAAWPKEQLWLPALGVNLDASFLNRPKQVKQGEALELIIHLDVIGQQARNLPQFKSIPSEHWRIEPLTEVLSDRMVDGFLVGSLQQRLLFYPKQLGRLKLPDLTLHWWDTQTHKAVKTQVELGSLVVVASGIQLEENISRPIEQQIKAGSQWHFSDWLGWLLLMFLVLAVLAVCIWLVKNQPKTPPLPPLNPE